MVCGEQLPVILSRVLFVKPSGQPEISQLDVSLGIKQDVVWLDVSARKRKNAFSKVAMKV